MDSNRDPSAGGLIAVGVIHLVLPLAATAFFLVASCVRKLWPPENADEIEETMPRRSRCLRNSNTFFIVGVVLTYIVDSVAIAFSSSSKDGALKSERSALYDLSSALLWFVILLWYLESQIPAEYPVSCCWAIYLAAELALLSISCALHPPDDILNVVCQVIRISFLLVPLLLPVAFRTRIPRPDESCVDEEIAPLLECNEQPQSSSDSPQPATTGVAYGSCNSQSNSASRNVTKSIKSQSSSGSSSADSDECVINGKNIWEFVENLKTLIPFFWPSGRPRLQLAYVAMTLCMVIERAINVIIPLQVGLITNILSESTGVLPWKQITLFVALRLLDSASGLQSIRRFIYMPLEDFSYEKLSTSAFNHVMALSCDYHDNKQSGKLWQTINRGQSVKDVVNNICFTVFPTVVDLALAVSVLYYVFDAYMALIVAFVAVMFVWTSAKIISKQREKRKAWIKTRTQEFNILYESTTHWQTVSYFNRVPHEESRYSSAVGDQLKTRFSFKFWNQLESTTQSFLLELGLLVACIMAAYQVAAGQKPLGSFIMLISYWSQLSGPLELIANGLGDIALDMVDAEEYLELLRQKPTITEPADAKPVVLERGDIEFSGVNFSYDSKREVLRDVNFQACAGQTTALVGQTGGGKSTTLKLISRFYDPTTGTVKIDGQDVSQVTLSSLRENIGVVPQDPALFHDTIMNNIRYARFDVSDDEVIEACKAVDLHENFLSFTDGYDTIVGERGAKLSGGELQRVAIARAIIKNPRIVLLDEATSSVDSETEAHVQESLKLLAAGRTTLIVAHRLSTIMNADKIIVVNDGRIVEQGSHVELLRKKAYYYRLCSRQGVIDSIDPKKNNAENIVVDDAAFIDATTELSSANSGADGVCCPVSLHGRCSYSTQKEREGSVQDGDPCQVEEAKPQTLSQISTNMVSPKKVERSGQALKAGAAEFVPRSHRIQGDGYSQSCLSETDGNQDTQRDTNRFQFGQNMGGPFPNKSTAAIAAGKENWQSQSMEPVMINTDWEGQPTIHGRTDDGGDQKLERKDPAEHTFKIPRHPTPHTRKFTKSEPTPHGLSFNEISPVDPAASNHWGVAAPSITDQSAALAEQENASSRPQRRRRRSRKRNLQNKGKEKDQILSGTDASGSSKQHHNQAAETGK